MMEIIGARLKKARLEKGISLEDAQKKTKIHLNILKAIEEDNLSNISPIYIKGFLKIYSKFLSVDISGNLPAHKGHLSEAGIFLKTKEKPGLSLKAVLKQLKPFLSFIKIKRVVVVLLAIVAVLFIFKGLAALKNRIKTINAQSASIQKALPQKAPAQKISAQKAPAQKTLPLPQQAVIPAKINEPAKPALKKSVIEPIRLSILAKDDCWITLKADGKVIFQGTLKKGKSENWQAEQKIEFSLNNSGAVSLIVNGEHIPSLGKKSQALKNILVTKEGLNIP